MTLNEKCRFQLRDDLLKCFEGTGVDIANEQIIRRADRFVYNLLLSIEEYLQEEAVPPGILAEQEGN